MVLLNQSSNFVAIIDFHIRFGYEIDGLVAFRIPTNGCFNDRFGYEIDGLVAFRIPTNGCFNDIVVQNFQRKLLKLGIDKARNLKVDVDSQLKEARNSLVDGLPDKLLESVWWHVRLKSKRMLAEVKMRHATTTTTTRRLNSLFI